MSYLGCWLGESYPSAKSQCILQPQLTGPSHIFKCHHHHHHHVVPLARISLALSRHFSLSCIAFGRSSGLHPVSSHSCCMYVRVGRPAFARPYMGVHRSTSLMSSSLLLQQCPACLVRLTWIVFVMGSRWSYTWCLVGCCRHWKRSSTNFEMEIQLYFKQISLVLVQSLFFVFFGFFCLHSVKWRNS